MENFRQMAEQFSAAKAWAQIANAAGLAATWQRWLEHPEEAASLGRLGAELVASGQGSLANTLDLLQPMLRSIKTLAGGQP
jgi:3-deoxy-D-manno-octulosonic-acid transferase